MAESKGGKGADFGRGTKNMPGQEYTKILEGDAPKQPEASGKPDITDKTS